MKTEDIIKKSLLVGVGVAALAKEGAEKVVKELIKKGHINTNEGKRMVRKILSEAERSGRRVATVMESELKKAVKGAKKATGMKTKIVKKKRK